MGEIVTWHLWENTSCLLIKWDNSLTSKGITWFFQKSLLLNMYAHTNSKSAKNLNLFLDWNWRNQICETIFVDYIGHSMYVLITNYLFRNKTKCYEWVIWIIHLNDSFIIAKAFKKNYISGQYDFFNICLFIQQWNKWPFYEWVIELFIQPIRSKCWFI